MQRARPFRRADDLLDAPISRPASKGGQYFNWFYNDGNNGGRGLDPNGSGLQVSPAGRRSDSANPKRLFGRPADPSQQATALVVEQSALRRLRRRRRVRLVTHGPHTGWVAQSKSIMTLEYGFSAVDKATNQPNVFFDAKSTESATPYWSIWDNAGGLGYLPRRDDTIAALALQAVYDYWITDGNNATSGAGLPMLNWTFACVWNWDARPWPIFPLDSSAWGDTGNWAAGDWTTGLRTLLVPPEPTPPPTPGSYATFPDIATLGWSIEITPRFSTGVASHSSGRETPRRLGRGRCSTSN